jgi:predicted Zn-dependent protease
VQAQPGASLAWVFLSGCEAKLGHRPQALDYAQHAIKAQPEAPGTWLRLAEAENALGHIEKAKQALTQAQKLLATGRWD